MGSLLLPLPLPLYSFSQINKLIYLKEREREGPRKGEKECMSERCSKGEGEAEAEGQRGKKRNKQIPH